MENSLSNEELLLKYRFEKIKYKKEYYAEVLYEKTKKLMYSKLNSFIKRDFKIEDISEVEFRMNEAWYDAIRYCDPSKSKFSTYLTKCLERRIYKYLVNDQFSKKHVHAETLSRYNYYNSIESTLLSETDLLSSLIDKDSQNNPYDEIIHKLFVEDSLEKLKNKNKSYYDVIHLSYVKRYSQQQVSQELGISQPQVSRRLSRALFELKQITDDN